MTRKTPTFINREISWLYFNNRVLQEAANSAVPLLERLRFVGIYSNNMDEFYRVRVATLQRMVELKIQSQNPDEDPKRILKKISKISEEYQTQMEDIYHEIIDELSKEKIHFVDEQKLTEKQIEFVNEFYDEYLEDAITPIMLSNDIIFPELNDLKIYFFLKLTNSKKPKNPQYALIEFPGTSYSRFLELPGVNEEKYVILLDDVIRISLPILFKSLNFDTFEAYTFKITRDAEMEIDDDMGEGIVEKVSKGIKSRRFGHPMRFVFDREMPEDMKKYLLKKLEIKISAAIIPGGRYHNFKDFISFPTLGRKDLEYKKNIPVENHTLASANSVIKAIEKKDMFLHYPFYNFSQYVQLLREAAINPNVTSIKITIYRMAHRSKVARALIFAAKNGKRVTAVVELRARFDEEHNISWAQRMQDAGINVVFGVEGLKIHSKLTLISFKDDKKIAAISTGNFHEGNAAVYTDFTIFTANQQIAGEVDNVFNFINRPYYNQRFMHLLVSPLEMRTKLFRMIQNEIINAKKGLPAYIDVKINHITDIHFVNKIYEAAEAGVKIRLAVRGMCSLVTTLPQLKGNLEVVSIVDKFLEHSRILIFCNNGLEKYFISSADWMPRNLDHRIEVAAPVYDKSIQKELRIVVDYALKDNVKARIVDGSGQNMFKSNDEPPFRSQFELMKHYKKLEN